MVGDKAGFPTVLKAIEELIKRSSDTREVKDEVAIEVVKAKENLYIPVDLRIKPFGNGLHIGWIHPYPVLIN